MKFWSPTKITAVLVGFIASFFLLFAIVLILRTIKSVNDQSPKRIERFVLVIVDTLRADHVGAYGYPRQTTPFIDSLADRGVVFRNAFSVMPTTSPAHASLFTSLHPIQHQVMKNGHILDDTYLTLAEVLNEAGYRTAAFVGTDYHFRVGHLDQGFEVFDEPVLSEETPYRQADETMDEVIRWLEADSGNLERLFLWVHLFDPHRPYRAPESSSDQFTRISRQQKIEFGEFLVKEHRLDPRAFGRSGKKLLQWVDGYDADVHFADAQIRRLYQFMEDAGLNSNCLWVLASDHGEGLGSHQWLLHGKLLYNEQIRVPLIFHDPAEPSPGAVVHELVETVDISPTLLEMAGVDVKALEPDIQGRSLVPLLSGAKDLPTKLALAQRRAYRRWSPEEMWPSREHESGEMFALQSLDFKYIYHTLGRNEFYDLAQDPLELINLSGRGLREETELRQRLQERLNQLADTDRRTPQSVDEESLEKLEALGYVQ